MHNFDALFWNAFVGTSQSNYPPVNIIQDDRDFLIEIGACGFSQEELEIDYDGRTLEVTATKPEKQSDNRVYHQNSLAKRDFKTTIAVRGQYDIGDVFLENGILSIQMLDKTERIKPKIEVRGPPVPKITKK